MLVDFNTLPDNARIWIYQSNRPFNKTEKTDISLKISEFLSQWTAHGSDLKAGFTIEYNRFIIIGLNQDSSYATGCSIDASVHFIQQLEQAYYVDLLDKMNVTYKQGEHIAYKALIDFKKMAKEKAVSANTIVFNNLVNNVGEFKEFWEVPAHESWHNRFF